MTERGGTAAVMTRCTHYPPGGAALAAWISCSGGLRRNIKVRKDEAAPAATAMPNAWVVEAMVSCSCGSEQRRADCPIRVGLRTGFELAHPSMHGSRMRRGSGLIDGAAPWRGSVTSRGRCIRGQPRPPSFALQHMAAPISPEGTNGTPLVVGLGLGMFGLGYAMATRRISSTAAVTATATNATRLLTRRNPTTIAPTLAR